MQAMLRHCIPLKPFHYTVTMIMIPTLIEEDWPRSFAPRSIKAERLQGD